MKSVRMKFRLLIDAFLIIVFAFLYKKNAISLPFHEGAGLAILVLSLLHFLIGSRFVTSVTKRLCNHTTPWQSKVMCIVDILLLLSTIFMLIDSVLISRSIFPFGLKEFWTPMHFFVSAIMLMMIGCHLGLHAPMLIKRWKVSKPMLWGFSIAIAIGGGYGLYKSKMGKFLSAPFLSSGEHGAGGKGLRTGEATLAERLPDILPLIVQYAAIILFFALLTALLVRAIEVLKEKTTQSLTNHS